MRFSLGCYDMKRHASQIGSLIVIPGDFSQSQEPKHDHQPRPYTTDAGKRDHFDSMSYFGVPLCRRAGVPAMALVFDSVRRLVMYFNFQELEGRNVPCVSDVHFAAVREPSLQSAFRVESARLHRNMDTKLPALACQLPAGS
ncbi:hypothetical protein PCANC_09407 [Puccinia coronata f. sp. avenae]|uniref:Uncharacterized protein n=1 Tax=Puccinia coronata f. sp. avenae TaxID=200324 RepID=A0A2N5SAQ2_9BASI|nr:hypothetical protein PCANC_19673 [Puccinia coronata f. sp. avenae]PLW48015.1 hypothetical protein PCANC_09407 [Puccinia coronata f. sp. avenae]